MTDREIMEQAADVLQAVREAPASKDEIQRAWIVSDLLRRRLAQPEQEPVATVRCINGITIGYLEVMQPVGTKLYTTPPQRTWVGLTDEERAAIYGEFGMALLPVRKVIAEEIEAKLREKNT